MSNSNDFQHLATIVRELRRFGPDMGSAGHQLNEYVTLARSIIRLLDQAPHNQRPLIQRAAGLDVQVFIVSKLQDLAYYEPDMGAIGDIADWCVRQWLRLLQDYPEDVGVLQGLWCFTSWDRKIRLTPC